jgi:hypothetical protein
MKLERLDPDVARVLRRKSGMERLRRRRAHAGRSSGLSRSVPVRRSLRERKRRRGALTERGQFNIIHGASGVKIDVFIGKDTDRHLRDVAGISAVSGPLVDVPYVDRWARTLGVGDLRDAARGGHTAV